MTENKRAYGVRVEEHFKSLGLTMLGWGRLWIACSGQGWSDQAKWSEGEIAATLDGLRLAAKMAEIESLSPGDTGIEIEDMALRLPLGLSCADLEGLDSGEWVQHVANKASPDARERLAWGLSKREPWVFEAQVGQHGFDASKDPWGSWIKSKGLKWLSAAIARSIAAFESLGPAGLTRSGGLDLKNSMDWIGARLGEPKERVEFLSRMSALFMGKGWAASGLEWLLIGASSAGHDSFGEISTLVAEALGVESGMGKRCWESSSPWVRSGFLRHAKDVDKLSDSMFVSAKRRHGSDANGQVASERLFEPRMDLLDKPWESQEDLMACFYAPFDTAGDLDLEDWSHIGQEVKDIAQALRRKPVKILMWGEPGSGKSSLAGVLAKASGLTAIEPSRGDRGLMRNKGNDLGLMRLWEVETAERLSSAVGSPLLVVDECEPILLDLERKLDIAKCLESRASSQIWIANSLKDAHEAYLRRFDYVLKVPPMPLENRERLASRLFGDSPLASRLAQSMRNPSELVAASQWCQAAGETSWGVVSRRMAGHQRAVGSARSGEAGSFEVVSQPAGSVNLGDFAGSPRLSAELVKIAGYFNDPGRFAKLGAKIPKGYLLSGPPGTGKTLFVRVLSAVAGVPMVVASGAALAQEPERFAELFAEARKRAPCLVFVDEFDVCAGKARDKGSLNLDRQKILNRLLVELDGFDPLEGVLFLGATHNGSDVDEAVKRAGRLGRELVFSHPGPAARQEVWKSHLSSKHVEDAVDWERLSEASRGFSCAEIAEACERAKLDAAMRAKDRVGMDDLLGSCDEVFWGEPGEMYLDEDEKWRTAIHEAGHALAALRKGLSPERATVRPRGGYLGAVAVRGKEGSVSMDMSQIKAQLVVGLAGFAAEKVVFGAPGNGASGDLSSARELLERALLEWGMGDGPKAYLSGLGKSLSQGALMEYEREAEKRMGSALAELEAMFEQELDALKRLAAFLLEKHELGREEIERCAGPKPEMKGAKDTTCD